MENVIEQLCADAVAENKELFKELDETNKNILLIERKLREGRVEIEFSLRLDTFTHSYMTLTWAEYEKEETHRLLLRKVGTTSEGALAQCPFIESTKEKRIKYAPQLPEFLIQFTNYMRQNKDKILSSRENIIMLK